MATLTTALIRDAKPRARMYELTCSGLPGFLLRVLPTGKKVFLVRHRSGGRDHRTRLGLWSPELTVEEARRRAAVILGGGEVDVPANPPPSRPIEQARAPNVTRMKRAETDNLGAGAPPDASQEDDLEDSLADTAVALPRPRLRSASTTIAALAERFLREYVDVYLKPRTGWNYHHYMAKFILPKFGKRDFRQVSRSDVQALHTGMKDVSVRRSAS